MAVKNRGRWALTIILWIGAVGAIRATTANIALYDPALVTETVPLIMFTVMAAIFGTVLIWGIPEFLRLYQLSIHARALDLETAEKAKRGRKTSYDEKLALLMELMDEDERAAFKESLKVRLLDDMRHDDGELPFDPESLDSLWHEETGRRLRQ